MSKLQQRQNSMDLLLAAALRLFVSQGYRSTNLEQISGEAKLTKGAVYFYFRSKEAVLLSLLEQVQKIVVDDAVHYQANLGITHRDEVLLLILMSLEFKEREGAVNEFIARLYKKQRSFVEALVKDGQDAGEFRVDVRSRELAATVLAVHDGTFLEWFRRSSTLKGAELVRALRSLILWGILAPDR